MFQALSTKFWVVASTRFDRVIVAVEPDFDHDAASV
jgi:hypothetical protein